MAWFTDDTFQFFRDLEQNNDREWFHANKKRYEDSVKNPLLEFAGEMIVRMQELDPGISMNPKDAVFRIHRDTRFSKNKLPYKTNGGLVVSRAEKHSPGPPGLYFHIEAERMAVASGFYFALPEHVRAIRSAMAQHPDEFQSLISDAVFVRTFGEVQGEKNKIVPPEFREALATQPLIANKQFFYWAEHNPKEALREDLPEFVMGHIRAAWPVNQFFSRAVGF